MATRDKNTSLMAPEDHTADVEDTGEYMGSMTGMTKMIAGLRQEHWEVDMAFQNLSYTVDVKKTSLGIQTVANQFSGICKNFLGTIRGLRSEKKTVLVLNSVSDSFAAGTTTLVLAPPGCGVSESDIERSRRTNWEYFPLGASRTLQGQEKLGVFLVAFDDFRLD